jgi:hypothetical protein
VVLDLLILAVVVVDLLPYPQAELVVPVVRE